MSSQCSVALSLAAGGRTGGSFASWCVLKMSSMAFAPRLSTGRNSLLALATRAAERGELVLVGALADPTDGAVLVWRVADRAIIEEFVRGDPYVINGLVRSWSIRPWNVMVGSAS